MKNKTLLISLSVVIALLCILAIPLSVFVAKDSGGGKTTELRLPELKGYYQYYQSTFPSGLIYSDGWYGTFEYAPENKEVILYDDTYSEDWGICVFGLPFGANPPSKPQGGTSLKELTLKEVEALLKSYKLETLVKSYDKEILEVMPNEHKYIGAWAGDKLKDKFTSSDWQDTEEVTSIDTETGNEVKNTKQKELTPKQQDYIDSTKDVKVKAVDLERFDPDRYFVMGQTFFVDGTADVTEEGRHVADATINVVDAGGGGNFAVYMANGTTGTIASGTSAVTDSPVTLSSGLNTITITGTGNITLDITIGTAANWNTVNSWSATSGGACGASVTTSADNALFDANSFTAAGQTATVDATMACLSMDWTGVTNSPVLAGTSSLDVYGNVNFTDVNVTWTGTLNFQAAGSLTSGGNTLFRVWKRANTGTLTLTDTLRVTLLTIQRGVFVTNDQAIVCSSSFGVNATSVSYTITLTLGSSVITCGSYTDTSIGSVAFSANTSTINILGTGEFAGGTPTGSYYDINLNGTAHTVSGTFGFHTMTRNGTATNANSVTFISGTTITGTTMALIGNSRANQLLAKSSTLGTAATIDVTNWTGTLNCDLMDITSTNAVDFSAAGLNNTTIGDAGGNTGFTFIAGETQNFTNVAGGSFSTAGNWTSRIPLVGIDDVTITTAFNSGVTLTWDIPRMGKSIDYSGMSWTGVVTRVVGSTRVACYGSYITKTGMTHTYASGWHIELRGRGNFVFDVKNNRSHRWYFIAPSGVYTYISDIGYSEVYWECGTINTGSTTLSFFQIYNTDGYPPLTVNLESSRITLTASTSIAKLRFSASSTINPGTSTIVLTNSTSNAQIFAGGGLTYNNVTVQGAGNYALTITGENTFNTFTVDTSVAAKTIKFTDTTTTYVANIVHTGTTLAVLTGTAAAGWNIEKTGVGTIGVDYINLSYSAASPANTFYAGLHSTNSGGNTGWIWAVPDAPINVVATNGTDTSKVVITWDASATAHNYRVYRNSIDASGLLGDVQTYDDTSAPAPTITPGIATATQGTFTDKVTLSLAGESANDGTTVTYYVVAINPNGDSLDSATDTGYRGVGVLTYQWQVSSADADADYSDIGGATTNPYDYMSPPSFVVNPPTSVTVHLSGVGFIDIVWNGETITVTGRYYRCYLTATDAIPQYSTSNRGYTDDVIDNFEVYSDPVAGGAYATFVGSSAISPLNIAETVLFYKVKSQSSNGTYSILSLVYGVLGLPLPPTNVVVSNLNGNLLVFTFDKGLDADNTVAVLGTMSYPQSLIDGTIIYNDTGNTFNYTNSDTQQYFISMFSTNGSGTSTTSTDTSAGGGAMIFIGLIVLAGILSFFAFKYPNYLLAIVSGAAWIVLIPYLATSPFGAITPGSNTQQILMIIFGGAGMTMLVIGIMRTIAKNRERVAEVEYYKQSGNKATPKNYEAFIEASESKIVDNTESEDAYRQRVRGAIRQAKNRARGR